MNYKNPQWWTQEYDSAWDRVKDAFSRDWKQTKHDLGGKQPDLKQDVPDTVKQAAGKQPIPPGNQPNYEVAEPAYRFGYGARRYYGKRYTAWSGELETELRKDWSSTHAGDKDDWEEYRRPIRQGWDYANREGQTKKPA